MSLRFGLPAVIFLVFLGLSGLSYYFNLRVGEANSLEIATANAMSLSERLARAAQIELADNKAELDNDVGVESADLRVNVLAVADEAGKILAAHRLEWVNSNIAQRVPGFDQARLREVTQGRLPFVKLAEGQSRRLHVLTPFIEAGRRTQIRSLASGVVYLEYDLAMDDALNRWRAQRRWAVEALLAMTIAALLSLVMYRRVARHLLRIEAASRMLSDQPDLATAVPIAGPLELRQLAVAFNAMAARVQLARRDIASQSAKLSAIFGSAMDAIITVDASQRVTMINGAALELFGYTREQAIGMPLEIFLPPRYRAAHAGMVKRFGQQGDRHRSMGQRSLLQAVRASGEEFPIRASISHLLVDGEELYTVIVQDVSKEVKAEQEIRQLTANLEQLVEQRTAKLNEATLSLEAQRQELAAARDELQTIFDSATVGIVLAKDRVLWRCNPRAASMLGYTRDELNGQSARILYPTDEIFAQAGTMLYQQLHETEVAVIETPMAHKDGALSWMRINARQLDSGSMRGMMLAFLEDVSLQHAANDAMREAMEKANEASAAKANFLANMSHEIRTPMNAIIGMSYLALQTDLDSRQRNYIEKVHRSGENLLGIINDILDFSKIEAGKLTMESVEFDLETVMDNLANLIGFRTEDKGLELLFQTAPDVPYALMGDPLRLGQVLINLGINAVKFTEQGEIVVGIEKVRDHDDGVELHFWVRDSGIGMTPEQCGKLFQSFSQADASTTRKYGGTGLGLAICKSLVEAMRGTIWVESEPGQGSCFHFHARFGVQAAPHVQRHFRADDLLGLRLLVVDDNATAREILVTMARRAGLTAELARDGAEALHLIESADQRGCPYDLVLMDWKMPGMDGIQALCQLGAVKLRQAPIAIMITSFGRDDVAMRAREAGVAVQSVLTKPVTPSGLLDAVADALGRGRPGASRTDTRQEDYSEAVRKLRGARVLLVEDNDMNQELALELLSNAGIEVVLANHGGEALDILQADRRFDGILMDCHMPVMDGYEATQAIRRDPALKDLPIIAMTANAMAGDKEKVQEAGMSDHVAKPLRLGEMFSTMAKWISPAAAPSGGLPDAPAAAARQAASWELPGIDTVFGLGTAMNKVDLYRRLLVKFRDGHVQFEASFRRARAGTDPVAAERCAHTLASTAATVGAQRLHQAAKQLELACQQHAGPGEIDTLLQAVLEELAPVLGGLATLDQNQAQLQDQDQPPAALPAPALTPEQVAALRLQLQELVDQGDARAIDLCHAQQAGLQQAYPHSWKQIEKHLYNVDFEAAMELVVQAGQGLEE